MRIVFFGSPGSALPSLKKILDAGHRVELIISQPDKPTGRGKKLMPCPVKKMALDLNIPVSQPSRIRKDAETLDRLKDIQPDLNVVVAYGQIIPSSIIYLPKYNSLNVHFSLLPKYRGASPIQWALLNGEEKTGITIFELNEKMDEGDILTQAELLIKTIAGIKKIKPVKQDHTLASLAPKLSKEDGRIDWTKDSLYIQRQLRAFNPWPSTFAFFGEKRIKIHKGKKIEGQALPSSSPGEILEINKDGIQVCCGEQTLFLIERVQPENRNIMDAYAFSLGGRIIPGDKLT
jgi:methionyl-tRNA formyltransferase